MAFLDRFRNTQDADDVGQSLTASAKLVEDGAGRPTGRSRRSTDKQQMAWDHYDKVPELWFAVNYIGNALRRVRLYPAVIDDPMQPPVPLEDGPLAAKANAELDRLRGTDGTHGDYIHDSAVLLTVPGEGLMALYIDDDGYERSIVASTDELVLDDNGHWSLYDDIDAHEGVVLGDPVVNRIWRPHPRFRMKADSAFFPLETTLEELIALDQNAKGAADSWLLNGLWMVPDEINWKRDPRSPNKNGYGYSKDPYIDDFINMAVQTKKDERSAARFTPAVTKVAGKLIEQFRYQTFGRSFSPDDAARYQVLLRKAAGGIDIPLEIITGIEDLNHWNAWMIPEESFDVHLAPLMQLICGNATTAHMQPALGEVDQHVLVWFDASALTSHPGRGLEADNALRLAGIGYEAWRRYRGYSETDAATQDDIDLLKEVMAGAPAQPGSGTPGSGSSAAAAMLDVIAALAQGQQESRDHYTLRALRTPPPSEPTVNLTRELTRTDRELRMALQAASHHAVRRAIEKTGATLRPMTSVGEEVDDFHVCATIGSDAAYQLASLDEIISDAIAPVLATYGSLVAKAQRKVRKLASQYGVVDPTRDPDDPDVLQQQDSDRHAGASLLLAGLVGYVSSILFAPDKPHPVDRQQGEFSTALSVPPGIVRDALTVAGGSTIPGATDIAGTPQGGVSTGETSKQIFARVSLVPVAWMWSYGDGERKTPFEGHLALDGEEFLDWSDDKLAVRAGDEWLGTANYFPGDHLWCQCDFGPVLGKVDDGQDEEAQAEAEA